MHPDEDHPVNRTRAGQAPAWLPAAFCASLLLVACFSCGGGTEREVVAGPSQRNSERPVAASETQQLDLVARALDAQDRVRVLVRLEGVVPPIEAPRYDSRAKRSDVRARPDKVSQQTIATAQQQFLAKLPANPRRNVTRFRHAPYLAFDVNRADVQALQSWIEDAAPETAERPFRIAIEVSDALKRQSSAPAQLSATVEEALVHMEMDGFPAASTPSTIVLVDDRVDERLHLLFDQVDAVKQVTIGDPVDVPLATAAQDPIPDAYGNVAISHGTKVALVATTAAPKARIVALDVFGPYEDSSTEYVANALQLVIDMISAGSAPAVGAVNISLGDPNMATSGDCDCPTSGSAYVGCLALDPILRDHINILLGYQVPVVVAAGNGGKTGELFYPACLSSAVSVGATGGGMNGRRLAKAGVSNWGSALDLCAQGQDLLLKLDQWKSTPSTDLPTSLGSGSSFAAPFTSAAFSLLLDAHPDATCALIQEALVANGEDVVWDLLPKVRVPELRVRTASTWLEAPPTPAPPSDPEPEPPADPSTTLLPGPAPDPGTPR